MREFVFAAVLVVAAAAVVIGVAQIYQPAAWIVGGMLSVVLGWLLLGGESAGSDAPGVDE